MVSFRAIAAVVLLSFGALPLVASEHNERASGSPLNKVISMMSGMLAKGKAMKHSEEVEFAKEKVFCDTTRESTKTAIKTAKDSILQLKADIGKALADAEVLAEDITEVEAEIDSLDKSLSTASALRKKEHTDYQSTLTDFEESITAIAGAMKVLKSKEADVPQSLLQVQTSKLIPAKAKAAIQSFMALSDTVEEVSADAVDELGPPKPNAYEFQSGGVVTILEKLKLKFEDQKTELETEEASAKSAYELLKQQKTDELRDAKSVLSDKTTMKAKRLEQAADAKGDLDVTEKGKAADEAKLSDLNVECAGKSEEYDKNQVTRAEEIKALTTAVKILSSETVSGAADKHGVSMLSDSSGLALPQLRQRSSNEDTDRRHRVADLLQARAQKLGSRYLSLIAARAATDPFMKVKKMIKDLIVKLMEEANAEADNKGYCDSELSANKLTRDGKSAQIEDLTAEVEKLTADVTAMTKDLTTLSQEVSDLRDAQDTATKLRSEEKAINTETISDAKGAQVAVERATQVLKEFYAKAADASSAFLQNGDGEAFGDEMSQASQAPYTGMQAGSGGVIGMLEVVLSDFAKLESTTSAGEDEAASTYEKFMNQSTEDIAVKGVEMDHLEKKKETTAETIRSLTKELEATQQELDAALKYYEKLKPDCVDTGLSYQDRVAMRQEEIKSLQEAMKVLTAEDV